MPCMSLGLYSGSSRSLSFSQHPIVMAKKKESSEERQPLTHGSRSDSESASESGSESTVCRHDVEPRGRCKSAFDRHLWFSLALAIGGLTLSAAILAFAFRGLSCPPCRVIDYSGYQCAPNGALPEVARARGCEWDDLSFHWWPKKPHLDSDNQALLQDFRVSGPWQRFYDQEGQNEIPPTNEVLTAGWVTRKEHLFHCVFTVRQTHLWLTKGFDAPFNYSHTVHCTQQLIDAVVESPPPDFNDLTVHGTPWPEHPAIVSYLGSLGTVPKQILTPCNP